MSSSDIITFTGIDATPPRDGFFNPDANWNWQPIAEAVKDLYLCRPTNEIFARHYAPDAVFEDPLGKLAPNLAFKGLAEFFTPTELRRFEPVDVTKDRIAIEIDMDYKPALSPISLPFKVKTILQLRDGKIAYHTDHWASIPLPREGFLGQLDTVRRRITGKAQELLVKATGGDTIGSSTSESGSGSQTQAGGSKLDASAGAGVPSVGKA